MKSVYETFKKTGSSASLATPLMPFTELTHLMGFEEIWEFEKRYSDVS